MAGERKSKGTSVIILEKSLLLTDSIRDTRTILFGLTAEFALLLQYMFCVSNIAGVRGDLRSVSLSADNKSSVS